MTELHIDVQDVKVSTEVVQSTTSHSNVADSTPTSIQIQSSGVAGPQGTQGVQGIQGVAGPSGIVTVNHGANAATARPSATVVYWIGSVLPTNAIATDLWYQT